MADDPRKRLSAYLDQHAIRTTTTPYPAHRTVEEGKALRGEMPGAFTKNLLLRDKKRRLFLVIAGEDEPIDLKTLHTTIGAKGRLGFAPADLMQHVLGVEPGSLTPFALINDHAGDVAVALDAALLDADHVNFHPLVNTESTAITPSDLIRFFNATGHEPHLVHFTNMAPDTDPAP